MKEYDTTELESRLYDFVSTKKENLNHLSYVLEFINYLNDTDDF